MEANTMLKQLLQTKKFFIIKTLFSFFLFAISFLLFKLISSIVPVLILSHLLGCFFSLVFLYFTNNLLMYVIDFMQIYYLFDSNQDIHKLSLDTLTRQFFQAIKSLFEKDNCYLKLIANLYRANSTIKENLYENFDENNPYSYLLEFRTNFLFKFLFDNMINQILLCTFYYVVITDSDLELEDYAKGVIFYYRIFPYLTATTLKNIALVHFIAFIFYILLSLSLLMLFHNFYILFPLTVFAFTFHRILICSLSSLFVTSYLANIIPKKFEPYDISDNDHDKIPFSLDIKIEGNTELEDTSKLVIKSSLSAIAKTKSVESAPNSVQSSQTISTLGLNSLLSQWKNNQISTNEASSLKVKSTHKYFKLDEEQLRYITSYSDNSNETTIFSNREQEEYKNLFIIDDIYTDVKILKIDFLLHIDEI